MEPSTEGASRGSQNSSYVLLQLPECSRAPCLVLQIEVRSAGSRTARGLSVAKSSGPHHWGKPTTAKVIYIRRQVQCLRENEKSEQNSLHSCIPQDYQNKRQRRKQNETSVVSIQTIPRKRRGSRLHVRVGRAFWGCYDVADPPLSRCRA